MMRQFLIIFLLVGISSCSIEPDPINYGTDACAFCRMTIVDNQHAAQLVTEKGKNYKYDAIECMINDLNKWKRPPVKFHLVSDYANPGTMTDALQASFLISEEIPSPMGENLSAFSAESDRNKTHQTAGGDKLNWKQLRTRWSREQTHHHKHQH